VLRITISNSWLARMALVADLVRQSKCDAQFFQNPDYTQHVYYISGLRARKVQVRDQWRVRKKLGQGGFGSVYLEECTQGNQKGGVRAVKKIQKPQNRNYYRELEAVALFSYKQVSIVALNCLER
jgi:serine/threonine protein kinase